VTRRRKVLIVALAVFGAVMALVAVPLVWLTWDESSPDTSDLAVQWPDVPEADNGLTYLLEAQSKVAVPVGKDRDRFDHMVVGRDWDDALAGQLVESNAEALALMDRAAACPRFQFPETGIFGRLDWHLTDWMWLMRVGCIRARLSSHEGRSEQALDEAMRVVRVGRAIQCGRGVQIVCLAGQVGELFGLQTLRDLNTDGIPPDRLAAAACQLASLPDPGEGMVETCKVEYGAMSRLVDDVVEDRTDLASVSGRLHGYDRLKDRLTVYLFIRPNATKRLMAESVRTTIDNARCPLAQATDLRDFEDPSVKSLWNCGGITVSKILNAGGRFIKNKVEVKTSVAITEALLALRAYKTKTGRLPQSLDELVPAYLPSVPLDDFDGKPIRYSAAKKIVYSVGEDFKDDGGMTREEARAWFEEQGHPLEDDEETSPWELPDPSYPIEF